MLDFDTLDRPFRLFQREVTKTMDELEPLMKEVYKHLKDDGYKIINYTFMNMFIACVRLEIGGCEF